MSSLGLFNAPQPTRRSINPAYLARILSGPEVARQQGKTALFEQLGQLPETVMGSVERFQQLKQSKAEELRKRQAFALDLEHKGEQIKATKGLGEERKARAEKIRRITDTAKKQPDVFGQASTLVRANPMFGFANPADQLEMLENAILMVQTGRAKIAGGRMQPAGTAITPAKTTPIPSSKQRTVAIREKFKF